MKQIQWRQRGVVGLIVLLAGTFTAFGLSQLVAAGYLVGRPNGLT